MHKKYTANTIKIIKIEHQRNGILYLSVSCKIVHSWKIFTYLKLKPTVHVPKTYFIRAMENYHITNIFSNGSASPQKGRNGKSVKVLCEILPTWHCHHEQALALKISALLWAYAASAVSVQHQLHSLRALHNTDPPATLAAIFICSEH